MLITACKQYCLAAGATQGNIAYTQTVTCKLKNKMMKLRSLLFFLICISTELFCQTNTESFFHRSKGDIIDPNGQQFNIKATNVSCWLYQENYIFGGAQNVHETAKKNLNDILGPNAYNDFSKEMMEHFGDEHESN